MGMNPWLLKRLVAGRRHEFEESARSRRRTGRAEIAVTRTRRPRGRLVQHVGALLISLGRRLAGPEGWARALDV